MRYHHISIKMAEVKIVTVSNSEQGVKKLGHLYSADRNINGTDSGEQCGSFFEK
jgi:hypothetical protein